MISRILTAVAFVGFTSFISTPQAAAQVTGLNNCTPAPQVFGQPQRCWDGRIYQPGGQQIVYFTSLQASNFIVLPNNQFEYAGATYRCPAVSKWLGLFGGAVLGNVVGKNITSHGHNLGDVGTHLGARAGQEIACERVQRAQLVAVHSAPQAPGRLEVYAPQQRHYCVVAGRNIEVAPHQSCLTLDDAVRAANTQQTPAAAAQGQPGPANAAFWGWYHPHANASNPMKCFSTKQISVKLPQCAEVEVKPANTGETELQWRERVATTS